jgi:hypothetical protein
VSPTPVLDLLGVDPRLQPLRPTISKISRLTVAARTSMITGFRDTAAGEPAFLMVRSEVALLLVETDACRTPSAFVAHHAQAASCCSPAAWQRAYLRWPVPANSSARRAWSIAATVRIGCAAGGRRAASIICTLPGGQFRTPTARGPSPRPPARGWDARRAERAASVMCAVPTGGSRTIAPRSVGARPLHREADALPARPCRRCAGDSFRMAEVGGCWGATEQRTRLSPPSPPSEWRVIRSEPFRFASDSRSMWSNPRDGDLSRSGGLLPNCLSARNPFGAVFSVTATSRVTPPREAAPGPMSFLELD